MEEVNVVQWNNIYFSVIMLLLQKIYKPGGLLTSLKACQTFIQPKEQVHYEMPPTITWSSLHSKFQVS
ncbi:hypothetical protein OPV22_002731 [Ensete ventricosum]|uniref:Uncharacterized protein n=1 Tax=Ensete ventricosum TaxID=4639 RepID=A0AAV8RYM4_ENSVE|nr:hypothetical protein OPV22_002731 [Ensete ventricosum]